MGIVFIEKNKTLHSFLRKAIILAIYLLLGIPRLYAEPDAVIYRDSIIFDEQEEKLTFPSFVTVDREMKEIYIIDGRGRVVVYTKDMFPVLTVNNKYGINNPQGLAVDKNGNLYIAQSANADNPRHRITVLRPCLTWERDIYFSGFEGADSFIPSRLSVDKQGNIYAVASQYPGVIILGNDGTFLDIMTPDEEGRKAKLTNVKLDSSGKIYLVSEEEGRIYVYDENRNFLFKFGEKGGSSGKLSRPKGVGVDEHSGTMYVVDYMRHTVSAYDNKGAYLFEFGGLGLGAGWFQFPTDIAVDDAGRIFIADYFNHRVQVFATRVAVLSKK
ncbi:MAG: hypothetical protein C4538_12250 [Nitrospiraceae bacterium]|nr:MAG: hypothetical protein C4538_12250 [Nitrospiraceae bacterium]